MKKRVLIDVSISCDPPEHIYYRGMEDYAKECERWVKEFTEFIRDHRSQDPVYLNVVRHYEDQCEFCGDNEILDPQEEPVCCNRAVEEWGTVNADVPKS